MPRISEQVDVHSLSSVRLKALWVLDKIGDHGSGRLTAVGIAKYLVDSHGINTSYQAVEYALKTARHAVHKNREGYRLMEAGKNQLKATKNDRAEATFIEPNKPFTAKRSLAAMISELSGNVYVCDPYVDCHTLDVVIAGLKKAVVVKLLTQKIADKPSGSFARALQDLKKEGYTIEVRTNAAGDLHDRYFTDKKHFWFSGNSLNHLGEKESMLISLSEDISMITRKNFEERWSLAIPVQ
ncbi:MAG: hypothetical protein WC813_04505 [Patescibacteria group bacterium]|jgi:hypothetical protein